MESNPLVEKYYDKLAPIYDKATQASGAWTPPTELAKAFARLSREFDSSLIIGIGTGYDLTAMPSSMHANAEGIDMSPAMLEQCAKKYPQVQLHHGDFMSFTAFRRAKYDVLVCSGTLEFIPDFDGFFAKCSSMLEADGVLILTYEPIIRGHVWQCDAEADTQGKTGPEEFKGFRTYRRTLSQFERAIKDAGLVATEHYLFVAYKKGGVDIVYNFAALERSVLPTTK